MKELIKNIKNLLKQRNFKEIEIDDSSEKGKKIVRAIYTPSDSSKKESVMVYIWPPDESVGVAHARAMIKNFNKQKIKNRFVIGSNKFTRMAKIHFEENNVEYILTDLLMLNILEHEYVPQHRILTNKEVEEILNKLKIERIQLPNILMTDPVAKIIGANEGNVIEIIRNSKTAGSSIAYRHVIKEL